MPALQIDFEDGFAGDTVVVTAGGRELWRGDALSTNPAVSLAAVASVEVDEHAVLEVAVPDRGLRESWPVDAPFLRVELAGGRLLLQPSRERPLHL
ncbi:MAG TPA: hypothetical protein VFB42_09315 [Gaiellaceae bacterium]|nr:hypothetical protein [Gaiellaceae bacterium]